MAADTSMMRPRELALYRQGMRCGHIAGQRRVGSYVRGEEFTLDKTPEAIALNMRSDYRNRFEVSCAADGYCDGYRLGAEGGALPAEVSSLRCPLPEEFDEAGDQVLWNGLKVPS